MNEVVLKTNGITKVYSGTAVLNNVSVELSSGKIYGLIGQNGAGKTTLMRIIAGLSFPKAGLLEIFGESSESGLERSRKRLGCMIEYPSLSTDLDAFDNIKVHKILRGITDDNVANELLKLVGLENVGKKKVKDYSLGMRQRLGIAIAMIGYPDFLVLDEPINGLDPVGMFEIRNLLKKLCEEKHMTLLISSHNLPHLYQIATDYIILHRGIVKQTISADKLDDACQSHIEISCTQPEKLAQVIESELGTKNYKVKDDGSVELYDFLNEKEHVADVLLKNGIAVTNLSVSKKSLEEYFMNVIGGELNV